MSREKYGFVYIWRDRKRNRYYIGCHWGSIADGYVCSSNWMRDVYKRRPEDFRRRILKTNITDRAQIYVEEQKVFDMIKPSELRNRYYNIRLSTTVEPWHMNPSKNKTVGQKISESKTGKSTGPCSPEKAKRISEAKLAKKHKMTEETKAKMSEAAKLRKASEETKAKMSQSQKIQHQSRIRPSQKPGWVPKPKKVHPTLHCQICQEPTNSHRRKFCDLHRYEGMNLTRAAKEGSKWHS